MPIATPIRQHFAPKDFSDRVAYAFTRLMRFFADAFFARRYGHRAVVLETVAAVPGMVGARCNICVPCAASKAIAAGSIRSWMKRRTSAST